MYDRWSVREFCQFHIIERSEGLDHDHHLNEFPVDNSYITGSICQRDEMSETQDPPQPLPQRPDGQPRLGPELRGPGERRVWLGLCTIISINTQCWQQLASLAIPASISRGHMTSPAASILRIQQILTSGPRPSLVQGHQSDQIIDHFNILYYISSCDQQL